jgi:hypothetical protein
MPLELNIENTVFSKQIYDAGVRAACDQFMHSLGALMAKNDIVLDDRHLEVVFSLSPRELSDLNILLHKGDKTVILSFLDGPRNAEPRGGKGGESG